MSTSRPDDVVERPVAAPARRRRTSRSAAGPRRRHRWLVVAGLVPILLLACLPAGVALAQVPPVDGPVVTVPAAQTTSEDTPLFFSAVGGNAISVTGPAATSGVVQLSVTSGRVKLDDSRVPAGVAVTGDDTAALTLSGQVSQLDAALGNMSFRPVEDSTDGVTLSITLTDGGGESASASVAITVSAFNDPPVNVVPVGVVQAVEDTPRVVPISVTDVDAGAVRVTLSVGSGSTVALAGTGGLTFSVGDGVDDTTVTFTGTVADVDAALAGLVVTSPPDYVGPVALTVVSDDQGSSGAGPVGIDTDTVAISVAAVNDPPVNSVPGAQTTPEDTPRVFSAAAGNGIAVADPDNPTGLAQVTLTVVNGTVTLGGAGGVTFISGDGVADPTTTFQGPVTGVNAVLAGLVLTPNPNFAGVLTLVVTTNDLGNTGSGGPRSDTDAVTVTVTAVDDPPTAVADAYSTAQYVTLTVPAPGVLDNDTDPDGDPLTAAVGTGPTGGTLTLNPDGSFTYIPAPTFSGADSFTYTATDGTSTSAPATVTLTVSPSEPPVVTVPGAQSIPEDAPLTFGAGNRISVVDPASTSGTVRLSVTGGTLSLGSTAGVTVSGNNSPAVTVSGPVTQLNAAMDNMRYVPTADVFGPATLTVTYTGPGGQSASGSVAIVVTATNDPPVNAVPTGIQAAVEDTPRTFSTIRVSDVDAGVIRMTLSATNGSTLTLTGTGGLTFTVGDGTSDATMTFTGTVAGINAALAAGLVVTSPPDYVGPVALTVVSDDLGSSGAGPVGIDTDTVAISVAAVNDPPVNVVPGAQTTPEDTPRVFSAAAGNGIAVADPDNPTGLAQVTLTVVNGTVTLGGAGGVTFISGDGVADPTTTFLGPVSGVNAALAGLVLAPNPNFAGALTLVVTTNDLGNTGSGGPRSDTDAVTVTVTAVDDPPTAVGDAYTTVQQTPLAVPAPGVLGNDTAAEAGALTAAGDAGPANGTLTLGPDGSFTYTPNRGFVGIDSFTYTATGGTATSAPATVTITVTAATCVAAPPGAIVGTAGNNTLTGTAGDDLLYGLGGNDTINGLGGNDLICGGAGNDTAAGGDGADRVLGEDGNDTVTGENGDDMLSGGAGNDRLDGGAGTNTIDGGVGNDQCRNPATGPGCP